MKLKNGTEYNLGNYILKVFKISIYLSLVIIFIKMLF